MGVMNVIRTGRSELYADVTDATLTRAARDAHHLAMVRALEMHSIMVVPLSAGGKALGTLTLVSGRRSRRYDASDLAFAEELAARAAVAVANAQIHRDTQEAMRGREEFLSVASHELNTPLTSLRLLVEMLRRPGADPQKTARRIEHVERQVLRMTSLVHDLLDVSRIVGGHLTLRLERVDLAAVVREVASRFEGGAVPFHLRLDEGAVGLWDALRVEQVVTNLLGNAVKYGQGRPVDVAVALDAARGNATLTVSDHGIGIALENQARIFQKFERAVSVRHFGGFGLGLWITRQAVVALGGTVRVTSAQGEGSTFEVELPLQGPTEAPE
jgi:signal transduction histidine kinase